MNILHVDCSPRMGSHRRRLSAAIVKKLLRVAPGASISQRDFPAAHLPDTASYDATTLSLPAAAHGRASYLAAVKGA
jgi:FMN-dependent NADH-azoreductase